MYDFDANGQCGNSAISFSLDQENDTARAKLLVYVRKQPIWKRLLEDKPWCCIGAWRVSYRLFLFRNEEVANYATHDKQRSDVREGLGITIAQDYHVCVATSLCHCTLHKCRQQQPVQLNPWFLSVMKCFKPMYYFIQQVQDSFYVLCIK